MYSLSSVSDSMIEEAIARVPKTYELLTRSEDHLLKHSNHVALILAHVLRAQGWDDSAVIDGMVAGLSHDAGKIWLSPHLLDQDRKYTEEDYLLQRRHPALGYEMLPDTVSPDVGAMVIGHHLTQIDGYPDAAIRENLHGPFSGRQERLIDTMGLADQIASIREERPYNGQNSGHTKSHLLEELGNTYVGSCDISALLNAEYEQIIKIWPEL